MSIDNQKKIYEIIKKLKNWYNYKRYTEIIA
jgi:hypothetical protein